MSFLDLRLTDEQLEIGVKKAVSFFTQNYKAFTAWEITDALRSEIGPQVAIPHSRVRDVVHRLMDFFVMDGFYEVDYDWKVPVSGMTAKRYSPTDLWAINNVQPALPQLNTSPTLALSGTVDEQKVVIPNIRVNSTLVRGISYDGTTKDGNLTVKLDSGDYTYTEVPFSVYLEFINADSKGQAFNKLIRGQYERLED